MVGQNIKTEDLKFAIYIRKSTEDKNRQIASLGRQLEFAKELADRNNYKVVKIFQESASAHKVANRPQFKEMLRLIGLGEINAIVCWEVNRLARNVLEGAQVQQLLMDGKIKCIHTSRQFFLPEDNILNFLIEVGTSTNFSRDLSHVVKAGMRKKNRDGGFNCVAPQGYLNGEDELGSRIIKKDPQRFDAIKKMFQLYLTNSYTVSELADIVNNDWGYISKKRKKSGGKPLSTTTIHGILENPFYMGKIRDFDNPKILHTGNWEPMITEEEYWKIQNIKRAYSSIHKLRPMVHTNTKRFELKGLMTCGCCGCAIVGEAHKRKLAGGGFNSHIYYRCTHKSTKKKCTMGGSITEEEATRQIYNLLDNYTIHPTLYAWAMTALEHLEVKELTDRENVARTFEDSIMEYEKRRLALVDKSIEGAIAPDMYRRKDTELQDKIAKLKEAKRNFQDKNKNWCEVIGKTLEILQNPKERLKEKETPGEKRAILQAIGAKAVLTEKITNRGSDFGTVTEKVIEIEPYPWLDKLINGAKTITPLINKGINHVLQGENGQKTTLNSLWSG